MPRSVAGRGGKPPRLVFWPYNGPIRADLVTTRGVSSMFDALRLALFEVLYWVLGAICPPDRDSGYGRDSSEGGQI